MKKRSILTRSSPTKRSQFTDEPQKSFISNTTMIQSNSSTKKVQLNIHLNRSQMVEEHKPAYSHSKTISFRLNPISTLRPISPKQPTINHHQGYHNPRLEEKLNEFQPILHVDLSHFHIIDADIPLIIKKIIHEKNCTELWLYANEITSQGASFLASSLKNNSTLKSLDLSVNQLTDHGVHSLTQVLSLPNLNSHLKILQLSKNNISDIGAKYLSEMLRTNHTLTELWLSNNGISNHGVKFLMNTLIHHNRTLKFLSLSMNLLITDLCVNDLIEMLEHNQTLKKFWISDCNLTKQGQMKLREKTQLKKFFQIEL